MHYKGGESRIPSVLSWCPNRSSASTIIYIGEPTRLDVPQLANHTRTIAILLYSPVSCNRSDSCHLFVLFMPVCHSSLVGSRIRPHAQTAPQLCCSQYQF